MSSTNSLILSLLSLLSSRSGTEPDSGGRRMAHGGREDGTTAATAGGCTIARVARRSVARAARRSPWTRAKASPSRRLRRTTAAKTRATAPRMRRHLDAIAPAAARHLCRARRFLGCRPAAASALRSAKPPSLRCAMPPPPPSLCAPFAKDEEEREMGWIGLKRLRVFWPV